MLMAMENLIDLHLIILEANRFGKMLRTHIVRIDMIPTLVNVMIASSSSLVTVSHNSITAILQMYSVAYGGMSSV